MVYARHCGEIVSVNLDHRTLKFLAKRLHHENRGVQLALVAAVFRFGARTKALDVLLAHPSGDTAGAIT